MRWSLRRDLPEHGLKKGDAGTIVHSYRDGEGFEVEFLGGDGTTLGVITLRPEDVEPAWNAEEIRRQYLRRWLEMTPAERLRWLEETMAELWKRVGRAPRAPRTGDGEDGMVVNALTKGESRKWWSPPRPRSRIGADHEE